MAQRPSFAGACLILLLLQWEPGGLSPDSGSQLSDSPTVCSRASQLTSLGLSCPLCKPDCGKNQTRSQLKESGSRGDLPWQARPGLELDLGLATLWCPHGPLTAALLAPVPQWCHSWLAVLPL